MYSDNRGAVREGLAQQRARLLSHRGADALASKKTRNPALGADALINSRRDLIRNGLLGFSPTGAK
jgi:hypothetical protein